MNNKMRQALLLRSKGKLEESNKLLVNLLKNKPEDPYLNYQVAWSLDILERESEAVYYYEKAIQNDLEDKDLEEAFIGLGSTYRALGKYYLAEKTLKEGINRFPSNNALKAFYSMVLYNRNKHAESMEILLHLIATTSGDKDIIEYKKALEYYSDKLDKTFLD